MLPELRLMQRLQEVDIEIDRLEAGIRDLEAQCTQHNNEKARRIALLDKLQAHVDQIASKRRQAEGELKQNEEKLAKFRKQVDFVKTPKEFEAVNHQISQAEGDVSRLEEAILTQMEEEEKASLDCSEKSAMVAKMNAKSEEFVVRATGNCSEKKALLKGLREDRITIGNQLPGDLFGSYEYLMRKHARTVLVPLTGSACGGCGGILIPRLVIDVKLGQKMLQCNHCERYLFTKDAESD